MANSERAILEESIANTIADYREGEIPKPDSDHVHRWIIQFDKEVRIGILKELDHVLGKTYYSKKAVIKFLAGLIKFEKIVGSDPCLYWKDVNFFSKQGGGKSQAELLKVFDKVLRGLCDLGVKSCGSSSGQWIYLDDIICSGNRVGSDICNWIKSDSQTDTTIHIICIALHNYGRFSAERRIKKEIEKSKKNIHLKWWRIEQLEDRVSYIDTADVLRLVSVPENADAQNYFKEVERTSSYTPKFRGAGSKSQNDIFASEEGRNMLEQEFFLAGLKIRAFCDSPADIMRPLGYQSFPSFGFGALIATYRNCPNNCPLALWWGDPQKPETHPLGKWYPLLPRKTHDQNVEHFFGPDEEP